MDDTQKALAFSDQIDQLLQSGSISPDASPECADLLTVAQNIANTDFSHESRIRQSLYARLYTAQSTISARQLRWQRRLLTAALSVIVLLSMVFTVPPLRSLAQEIVKRLQTITLTNAPSLFDPYLTATPTAVAINPSLLPRNLTLEQAISKAGFTPLLPTYIPTGYTLTNRTARVGQMTSDFELDGIDPSYCCVIFSIMQLEATDSHYPYPVGDVPIVEVRVRDLDGLWVQNAEIGMKTDANGSPQIMPANLLTWEENGYLFWMTSFDSQTNQPISQAEMLKIANNLQLPAN